MGEAKATVLIVDDEESIRSVVSRKLQEEGYDCVTAADGKEALWKAFMQDFDLVLADIKMPGMSGMEVLSQIANDHPDTGVVMMTAVAETQTAVEAMKMGAYDYVTKPFNLDDLVMRVGRALERKRLVLENREYQLQLQQKVERQVGQIQQYYREAIEALAREEMAVQELNAMRDPECRDAAAGRRAAANSGELSNSIKGFAKKVSQLIGGKAPDSLVGGSDSPVAQTQTMMEEEPQDEPSLGQEQERQEDSLVVYDGTVEIAIVPPVSLYRMLRLHEHLRAIPQIQVLNLGGSVDRGITIRLIVEGPSPLIGILRDLPEVHRASDESQESDKIVPARAREDPPVKRIIVELAKKPAAEAGGYTPE